MPAFTDLPEAFVSTASLSRVVSSAVKRGALRKLGSRLYSTNTVDAPEDIVRRNLWPLVAAFVPGALIADRTALENRPAPDGSIFLVAERKRDIVMPGVTLRSRPGVGALDDDLPFIGDLRIASPARAFLENMRPSRETSRAARTLPQQDVEERLERELRVRGEEALLALRDAARRVASRLDMPDEFRRLDALIGGLLGTRAARLRAPVAIARAAGRPYDPARLQLFDELRGTLARRAAATRPANRDAGPALPFFEAYFSNFIEGTEFAIDEAEHIVFDGYVPAARPQDAHDVVGTWRVVSDAREMTRVPRTAQELLELLQRRHGSIMAGRPEKGPGQLKQTTNRAGSTVFVAPELVEGTLARGFEMYRSLEPPLHRAIFMMFLISEVHPFDDGNGRVARVMMNAELVATDETRVVVPTVYRNNYLAALKALSHNGSCEPLILTLDFAQRYTAAIDFSDRERARFMLQRTHAFDDPNEAEEAGVRLVLPTPALLAEPG